MSTWKLNHGVPTRDGFKSGSQRLDNLHTRNTEEKQTVKLGK